MAEDLEEYLSSVAGLYTPGDVNAGEVQITLGPQQTLVKVHEKCSDEYLALISTRVAGAECKCKNGVISAPITFLNKEDAQVFVKKVYARLGCQGCGRISFEFSRDKKRLVSRCTICGHVRMD